MRMADVLMYRHYCTYFDMKESTEIQKCLFDKQEKIYSKKKRQEMDYWVDIPTYFMDDLEGP
jgi:hypothetical protein